jgi:prevent-host-death family protein
MAIKMAIFRADKPVLLIRRWNILENKYSIAEAKNKLPSIIHSVEKGPSVKLTRRGRPVAILLSIQEYERLIQKKEGFWRAFKTFRKLAEKEGIEISNAEFEGLRDCSPGREFEWS